MNSSYELTGPPEAGASRRGGLRLPARLALLSAPAAGGGGAIADQAAQPSALDRFLVLGDLAFQIRHGPQLAVDPVRHELAVDQGPLQAAAVAAVLLVFSFDDRSRLAQREDGTVVGRGVDHVPGAAHPLRLLRRRFLLQGRQ